MIHPGWSRITFGWYSTVWEQSGCPWKGKHREQSLLVFWGFPWQIQITLLSLRNSMQGWWCYFSLALERICLFTIFFVFQQECGGLFLVFNSFAAYSTCKNNVGNKRFFLMGNLFRFELLASSLLLMLMDCRSWVDNISTALLSLLLSENLRNFRSMLAKLLPIFFFNIIICLLSSDGIKRHVILVQKYWMVMRENCCHDLFS